MKILALEPYYAGSHRAFADGWVAVSSHDIHLLSLPGHHWKWRMRHSSWSFAEKFRDAVSRREIPAADEYDAIFTSSMANAAELRGLLPGRLKSLPVVCYFHENQLSYPDPNRDSRDVHFGLSNIASAIASECVFNSAFHRDEFAAAAVELLGSMADYKTSPLLDESLAAARIIYPGVDVEYFSQYLPQRRLATGPLRIGWAARWEHDKNFELLAEALELLSARAVDFELLVMGESFRQVPDIFNSTRKKFASRIRQWGYCASRDEYRRNLASCDVFVSCAKHEFFGISAVEAASSGVVVLLPQRLAYPEVFDNSDCGADLFYDGTAGQLAERLQDFYRTKNANPAALADCGRRLIEYCQRYSWKNSARSLDDVFTSLNVNHC